MNKLPLFLLFLLVSCTPAPAAQTLTVATASSLQVALNEVAEAFQAETGQEVTLVFSSTGQLTQQIENGAPYDIFLAADTAHIDRLQSQNLLLDESISIYAQGHLALVVNRAANLQIVNFSDLRNAEFHNFSIANPEFAPYGVAAQQALESAGWWDALQPKIVYGETVRQATQFVQSGDAEVGIVALSLADVDEVDSFPLDDSLFEPINHAMGILASSPSSELARQFSDFLLSPTGQSILSRYGLGVSAP